jgi:hypothetical protein
MRPVLRGGWGTGRSRLTSILLAEPGRADGPFE